MIGVEKHNINAGNSTDYADITVLDNVANILIATDINAGYLKDCDDDVAGELINYIDAGIW